MSVNKVFKHCFLKLFILEYLYKCTKEIRMCEKMQDLNNTQYFKVENEREIEAVDVLKMVYEALKEKGYNPVNQIVGYIMSGDPTYITSHKNARSTIMKVERDEIVEEVLRFYLNQKF